MNEEFQVYKTNLESFPHFTFLTAEERERYNEMDKPLTQMSLTFAKRHPFLWTKWVCGITPYDYQWKMLDYMFRYKRVAGVTARQVGKSFCIGGFAFWAAYNNVAPVGIDKRTKIGIVSRTEDQAKKLLKDIHKMVQAADATMAKLSRHSNRTTDKYFSDKMTESPTQFKIEFSGGVIEIFPPTGKVRGESLSFLIIDEADFLRHDNPEYFFDSEAMPTLKKTEGSCFLFSTPKGTRSFFYNVVRPDNDTAADGWVRIWYPWTIYKDDWENGWANRIDYLARGKELDFMIEYEAQFKSGKYTFFPDYAIEQCVDKELQEFQEWYRPVTIGLDFGDTHSRTVMTVVYNDPITKVTQLLWYKEFKEGYNNSLLPEYFKTLKSRYFIKEIIADDCVGGKTAIEMLRKAGFNVVPFVFRKDKNLYYEFARTAFMNKMVKLYYAPEVIAQLKSIEFHVTDIGNVTIKKPSGGQDDICDSLVMALSPYVGLRKLGRRMIL